MRGHHSIRLLWILAASLLGQAALRADEQFSPVVEEVNKKVVKVFGSGGYKGLVAYGTGILVSPQGHILTVSSHLLDSQDLRVHLADGRRFSNLKVLANEPLLDVALVKINEEVDDLPYFDVSAEAKKPAAATGDWVLAFSNQFEIATLDEPVTVQRGVIAAQARMMGRRGIFKSPYTGNVYVVDAITNNPGAAGGALTNRKGELLGIIGKELRNSMTDTWVNYAVPIQARAEGDDKATVSIAEFVERAIEGKYQALSREKTKGGPRGHHGLVLVPDVLERTPPYVEEVARGSPAARAGIRPDDLVVYVDGEHVISVKYFNELMEQVPPGAKATVEVRRGDRMHAFELELDRMPVVKKP